MTVAARSLDYIQEYSGRAMSGGCVQYCGGDNDAAFLLLEPKFRRTRKITLTGNRKNDVVLLAAGHVDDLPKL